MDKYQLIIGLVTAVIPLIITVVTLYFKYKSFQNKQEKKQEVKQETLHNQILEKFEVIREVGKKRDENIEILMHETEALKSNMLEITTFLKKNTFSNDLDDAIKYEVRELLRYHRLDNSDFENIIILARNETIKFANSIRYWKNDLTLNDIKKEISSIFDILKISCNNYCKHVKTVKNQELKFGEYLRNFTDINKKSEFLALKLFENHLTDNEYIDLFCLFVKEVTNEAVKAYTEFNKLA